MQVSGDEQPACRSENRRLVDVVRVRQRGLYVTETKPQRETAQREQGDNPHAMTP